MYASCLQSYFLNVDVITTHQVATAPYDEAEEDCLRYEPRLQEPGGLFVFGRPENTTGARSKRVKLTPTKKGIENLQPIH